MDESLSLRRRLSGIILLIYNELFLRCCHAASPSKHLALIHNHSLHPPPHGLSSLSPSSYPSTITAPPSDVTLGIPNDLVSQICYTRALPSAPPQACIRKGTSHVSTFLASLHSPPGLSLLSASHTQGTGTAIPHTWDSGFRGSWGLPLSSEYYDRPQVSLQRSLIQATKCLL